MCAGLVTQQSHLEGIEPIVLQNGIKCQAHADELRATTGAANVHFFKELS
jgi:hypothetical protein